jgi:chromosome segregation ATPase
MFGLRRFRFRSRERNRETDIRRLARIKGAVRSAILEAEAELKGLRARVAKTRRAVMSLLAQVEDREPDPACRVELTNLDRTLRAGEQSLAQLEDHHTVLRNLERRLDRLIDQPRVSALRPPST